MTATIETTAASGICQCGSGLPMGDDSKCVVCWFEQLPHVVKSPRTSRWADRHRARHDAGDYDINRELQETAAQDQDYCPECHGMGYVPDGDDWIVCECQIGAGR